MSIVGLEIAAEVTAAIRSVGFQVTLAPAQIGGNPWNTPSAAPSAVSVFVVEEQFRNSEIDGARIRSGDKKLLMEAEVIEPKTGDGLTIQGVAHRVESVMPEAPSGVPVMYTVQARRV